MGSEMAGCTAPRIHQINPGSAEIGDEITITGVGFGLGQAGSKIYFYPGIDAGVATTWDADLITVTVPEGAEKGYIYLLVEGVYSNPMDFEIPVEEILTCLPDTGQVKCYDESSEIECGSGYIGQDAEYDTGCHQSYMDNGDGTVSDNCTGLIWQQEAPFSGPWGDCLEYCENLELTGYSDWRLPNVNELQTLINYSRTGPCIDIEYFPGTSSGNHWTSTTHSADPVKAFDVNFAQGWSTQNDQKYQNKRARCVR